MPSLVIGLDISDSHVTSALVRIEQISSGKLAVERDTYFTRSFEINADTDPREILTVWIQCIDDLLLDFVDNYHENDNIVGIAIGIPGPMDYESGICYIQSPTFQKFFGLNLRLSIQHGLKDLIARWQHDYFDKCQVQAAVSSALDKLRQGQSRRKMTITPPATPRLPITFHIVPATLEEVHDNAVLKRSIRDFCGRHDDRRGLLDDDVNVLLIPRSRRETYFHDVEPSSPEKPSTTTRFTPKLWSIIEHLRHVPISFYNDATSFALGEVTYEHNQAYERILALTLSTGFSSAFIDQGVVITNREDVPPDGELCNCPYDQHSVADDWFSTRGLISLYKKLLRSESPDDSSGTSSMTLSSDERQQYDDNLSITDTFLLRRASNGDPLAVKAFQIFARLLGQFLVPYIDAFRAHLIIVSGDIAQVWYLVEDELNLTIRKFSQVHVYFSLSQGKSVCLGAVRQQLSEPAKKSPRQIHQPLLPVVKTVDTSKYDIYPSQPIPIGSIGIGHRSLHERLLQLVEENEILLIDGFVGTDFNEYADHLNRRYTEKSSASAPALLFYDSRAFLQTHSCMQREIYLQNPRSPFGRVASELDFQSDFLDAKKLNFLKANLSYPCVVIGPAASFVSETAPLVYVDLAKNELYYRVATETACSYLKPTRRLNAKSSPLTPAMYERKCLYFLDYPVFNKLKQELLPRMDYFIDGQRPHCPTWTNGDTLRQALAFLANQPIRVRPWFESASWGGQWLKAVCANISKHARNYSRSFEMITPENGLILSDDHHHLLELSWELFYGSQVNRILGNDAHCRLFSGPDDFPLRFNILDTIDGANLPIRCTPSLPYLRTHFGEKLPQDQTYYILETKQHWKEEPQNDQTSSCVYLGFHENVNAEEFHQALLLSDTAKQELNVDKYIQSTPSHVHDFFLIPHETVHACSRNQVVLEISTTPYLYSFELYDWLRGSSDGRSRLSSIEHGMKNLNFDRRAEQLRCQPTSSPSDRDQYEEQQLSTHSLHLYDVQRLLIEPSESLEIVRSTENRFHLCMLVEGDAVEVQYQSADNIHEKQVRRYNYIETFLIPASVKEYRLRPIIDNHERVHTAKKFILLVAFLKWDCEKLLK